MRTVALVSGGKDSCYNMMQCVAAGHTIVALANLQPLHKDELDSYMYQTVGHQGIDLYAEAMGLPLYREVITGVAVDQGRNYKPVENDEVEDLYRLLSRVKDELSIEAVAVGAILSDYQRIRVENVCRRLGLVSLAYLWRRNQKELLKEMIASQVEAVVIKVAALGLDPRLHLGLSLSEIQPHLLLMHEKYGLNVCGEGGEYETFTTDCPLFRQRLVIDEKQLVIHSDDPVASVGYLNLKLHLEPKPVAAITLPPSCKGANDFANDPNNTVFSDASDIELSETELESIEQIEHELKEKDKDLVIIEKECDNNSEGYTADEEIQEVVDHSSIYGNKHGWCFVGGVVGEGEDMAEGTNIALKKLINLLASKDLVLRDVCSVNLYMRDMAQYAALNTVYESHFSFDNPPPRVCVQVPLPGHVALILDAVAHKLPPSSPQETDGCSKERHTMHVQGISHWAPANIGPYSQAVKIGEVAVTSGQIGLVPGSMCLCEARAQALPLTHLGRVLRAVHPRLDMRSVMQSVCYTSDVGLLSEARRQLERRTAGALAQYAAVGALPKQAPLEWAAWAHTDNTRFHYEETGCNIGDYKVAITRRWNYENTVAAVVCCVATSSSPSSSQLFPSPAAYSSHRSLVAQMTPAHLEQVLEYAVNKLVNPQPDKDQPGTALNIRIFYQWESPLVLSAADVCARHSAALTLVPVRALHSAHTFLSISGLRLDE